MWFKLLVYCVVHLPVAHRSAQNCQTVGLGTKPAILPADEVLDEAVESGSTQTASTSAYDWWWKHQNTGVHFFDTG